MRYSANSLSENLQVKLNSALYLTFEAGKARGLYPNAPAYLEYRDGLASRAIQEMVDDMAVEMKNTYRKGASDKLNSLLP